VRLVYSTSTKAQFLAGTDTWMGPASGVSGTPSARSVPFSVDDSGAQGAIAYPICRLSDHSEFIPATDPGYWNGTSGKYNWNRIKAFAFSNGRVHFMYASEADGNASVIQHRSYAYFDMSTHAVAEAHRRSNPYYHYDVSSDGDMAGTFGDASSGTFVQDTTLSSRMYVVRLNQAENAVEVLRSDNGGVGQYLYATGSLPGSPTLFQALAFRYVMTDGSIYGAVGLDGSPGTLYPFKVTPN